MDTNKFLHWTSSSSFLPANFLPPLSQFINSTTPRTQTLHLRYHPLLATIQSQLSTILILSIPSPHVIEELYGPPGPRSVSQSHSSGVGDPESIAGARRWEARSLFV